MARRSTPTTAARTPRLRKRSMIPTPTVCVLLDNPAIESGQTSVRIPRSKAKGFCFCFFREKKKKGNESTQTPRAACRGQRSRNVVFRGSGGQPPAGDRFRAAAPTIGYRAKTDTERRRCLRGTKPRPALPFPATRRPSRKPSPATAPITTRTHTRTDAAQPRREHYLARQPNCCVITMAIAPVTATPVCGRPNARHWHHPPWYRNEWRQAGAALGLWKASLGVEERGWPFLGGFRLKKLKIHNTHKNTKIHICRKLN